MKRLIYILIFFMTTLMINAQIAVIAHKSVNPQKLNIARLLDIYSLNIQLWDSGQKIKVFDYKGDDKIKYLYYSYLGITNSDLKRIWLKKQFTGRAMPPETVHDEDEMIKKVSTTPNSIGFVSLDKVTKDVQVLFKFD